MTDDRNKMIKDVKRLLKWHADFKGETVDQTLYRLFDEHGVKRRMDFPALKFVTMKIRREVWNTDQLEKLVEKHHRIEGLDEEHELRPIVAVQYEDVFYLIDGNNRVNKWIDEGNTKPHKVYILEP